VSGAPRTFVEVASGFWVCRSRRDLTNSVVVSRGAGALLVDPAWDPDELAGIADWLDGRALPVLLGFATHAHHDHLLWHPRFGRSPRCATVTAAATAVAHRAELVARLGPGWPPELAELVGLVSGVSQLPWPGVELLVHDGHTPGHAALWFAAERVLIAGDMLSDVEIPLLEETGALEYDEALTLLRPYAQAASVVIPGHGTPGSDGAARWVADRRYLDDVVAGRRSRDERATRAGAAAADAANRRWIHRA
jgi:glyoxylase-like metal-dependent hydrolase (beta-lactamase superfamily II)